MAGLNWTTTPSMTPRRWRSGCVRRIPAGQEPAVFEIMARVPHPDAAGVLTVIGRHHPDKKIAKAARKSAYKAASRQVAQQR